MKESVVALVLLALIIGSGFYIRFDAAAEPMWLDECHTAWAVDTDSPLVVAERAADGNQPPMYFLLTWLVAQAFGISEFALRFVSLVAGTGLLIAAPFFAKKLTGLWSATVLVAGLIAFDGQFIYYAAEARSYALVQILGLVQAMLFWRILVSSNFDSTNENSTGLATTFAWTAMSILLLYCHYTSFWIIAAEVFIVACIGIKHRHFPTSFAVALGAIGVSLTPRLLNVSMIFGRRSNWSSVSSTERLWTDVEPWLVHWMLIPIAFAFAAMLFYLAKGPAAEKEEKKATPVQWRVNAWLLVWAMIGPVGIALADLLGVAPMALLRYSAVCWVAMALFAAQCLKLYPALSSWVAAIIILACSFFGNWWANELVEFKQLPTFRNQDWVTTVSQIADSESTKPIFQLADVIEDIDAITEEDERFHNYLKFPVMGATAAAKKKLKGSVFVVPTWNIQFTKQHVDAIRESKGCWLIVRGEFQYAVHVPGEVERYLKEPIEFKFIPNERMPSSNVHLIQVRMTGED